MTATLIKSSKKVDINAFSQLLKAPSFALLGSIYVTIGIGATILKIPNFIARIAISTVKNNIMTNIIKPTARPSNQL